MAYVRMDIDLDDLDVSFVVEVFHFLPSNVFMSRAHTLSSGKHSTLGSR